MACIKKLLPLSIPLGLFLQSYPFHYENQITPHHTSEYLALDFFGRRKFCWMKNVLNRQD